MHRVIVSSGGICFPRREDNRDGLALDCCSRVEVHRQMMNTHTSRACQHRYMMTEPGVGMKTDRIRTDITDIVFVFVFMSGFGFEYG
jgi:hypothetical protein